MTKQPLVSQVHIKVSGQSVQAEVMTNLSEAVIDQHLSLPDMFTLRFYDPDCNLLDDGPFELTKEIEIVAEAPDGSEVDMMRGEITALEPDFGAGMVMELVVRGYDKSHRLYRETKSQAFLNIKDSDLAQQIASAADLQADVEPTSTVYDHVIQDNVSDLAFLRQRAWRIGYECFVRQGKLVFRKPPRGNTAVSLKWGDDLLTFQPRLTLAEQVSEVIVRGWDANKLEPIVGQAENGRYAPQLENGKKGSQLAQPFGKGKLTIVNQPVVSQAEADLLAAARMDELSGAFVQAEGELLRRPDVQAGQWINLEGLGKRLSGQYFVTAATHIYNHEGFQTRFAVRGSRSGHLAEPPMQSLQQRWPGVVPAVVTNTEDPNDWGRVKVKFPWMTDEAESDWARVACPGAGNETGFYLLPAVGDEVLVAFEQGMFGRPFILGGLWNGQHAIPPDSAAVSGTDKPSVQTWHSRAGHKITLNDVDEKIEIISKGGITVLIDDANSLVSLKCSGDISIKADGKLTAEAGGDLKIKAGGNLDIDATGQVNVKGQTINLN